MWVKRCPIPTDFRLKLGYFEYEQEGLIYLKREVLNPIRVRFRRRSGRIQGQQIADRVVYRLTLIGIEKIEGAKDEVAFDYVVYLLLRYCNINCCNYLH